VAHGAFVGSHASCANTVASIGRGFRDAIVERCGRPPVLR
jgi:hypothetical protein